MKKISLLLKNISKLLNPTDNMTSMGNNIKENIFSGITVAIIALPLALAFGEISGLGPIVFRDEENILSEKNESVEFYDLVIAPYKGEVESYYISIYGILSYFKIIFATIWVVMFPSSIIVWKLFPSLPTPPEQLIALLNYPVYLSKKLLRVNQL